ncbi:MAG TPA: 6-phosphogluconolactonase [Nitrospirae bacterium]|nr:6-phosphogluconolactonase [bacterium BMS3Abin06]HDH12074.1 6-phosphogluconolactonase [Nitrospirota bacterium]HDZ02239.1 6-phosphogluconolactonase [Nitrospirota bacterium]
MTDTIKEIRIFKDIDGMADFAVEKWNEISEKEITGKGCFTVALSGGNTPLTLYRKLSGEKTLPWSKTQVFVVDERFVPYESEENNYHMISRILLRHVNIPAKNIHPVLTSVLTPQTSAAKYEEDLISYFKSSHKKLPQFDLVLLGIGEDGHTASLFPNTPCLKETRHQAVAVIPSDKSKRERITLTFPVINNSKNIVFLATGENKAEVIKKVIEEEDGSLPAAMVKPQTGKLIFLLDEAAGSLLSRL